MEEDKPIASRAVMVPKADSDTEINSLKSGEVGMIFRRPSLASRTR